jgi:ABC-2 type transport system permease protein
MIPALLIGDIILFIRFNIGIIEMLLLIALSIILPLISGLIGIIINLKYPKMDAINDTEVVKQSTSSAISVFAGFGLLGVTGIIIFFLAKLNISALLILLGTFVFFSIIFGLLYLYLGKNGTKDFNNITV